MINPLAFLNDLETEREAPSEIKWERMAEGLQEVGRVAVETVKEVGGFSKGSIRFNLEGNPDVAKTPELMEAEAEQLEAVRKKNFFSNTEAEQSSVASTMELRAAREQQAITINTKLHRGNLLFEGFFKPDGSVDQYTKSEEERADIEISKGHLISAERSHAVAETRGASALQAYTEGGAGTLEQGFETAGAGPKANLSVQAGS